MTTLDYIIIILLAVSLFLGFKKGLLKQLGSLAGVIIGIVAARLFTSSLSQWLAEKGYFDYLVSAAPEMFREYVNSTIAALILFIGGYFLTRLIVSLLNFTLGVFPLNFINRCTGAVFTVFINFLILSLILNFIQVFKSDGSIIGKPGLYDGKVAEWVMNLAPATFGATKYFLSENSDSEQQLSAGVYTL